MVTRGALTPGKDDKSFDINFKVVEKEFPSYLEFLVTESLNEVEQIAYKEGYVAYIVLDNGLLQWHLTGKRYKD